MADLIKRFIQRHKKYAPVIFFMGGFVWDSLTLRRIDGWYSNTILFIYLAALTLSLYVFNRTDDGRWKGTILERWEVYAPMAVQFFLGGLSSAYVIFFFQSVSMTKNLIFFIILVVLLFSNELFKHRISNKYLQFGAYFFVNFTFFIFFVPIVVEYMGTVVFVLSGFLSLAATIWLILYIYRKSPTTRKEVSLFRLITLLGIIYATINIFYYFNLIPPVPLSLQTGLAAHRVQKSDRQFLVSYEQAPLFKLWQSYDRTFHYAPGDTVFVFTSIFAPTDLKKRVEHEWKWYDPREGDWHVTDHIQFDVEGGREGGYRGYTFKENVWPGRWRIDVKTREGLVLGRIGFNIVRDSLYDRRALSEAEFE